MPVQTIECHIATVLMKRFLDGDDLPTEMLDELERHVKACPGCQGTLNNEKMTIEEVLDGPTEKASGLGGIMSKMGMRPATAGGFANTYPTEALVAAARTQTTTAPGGLAAFKNPKVLFLSAGLAIVLIAMSTVLRDPTMLLGKKAAASVTTDVSDESEKAKDVEKPVDGGAKLEGEAGHGEETSVVADPHSDGGSEATADSGHEPDSTHDAGGVEETGATDSHVAEPKPQDSHGADAHEPGKTAPTQVNGMKVPGEKTVDQSSVILVGPNGATEHKTNVKPVTKPKTTNPKPAVSHSQKKTTTRRSSVSKAPAKRAPAKKSTTPPKSGGIKVYDSNGKPVH